MLINSSKTSCVVLILIGLTTPSKNLIAANQGKEVYVTLTADPNIVWVKNLQCAVVEGTQNSFRPIKYFYNNDDVEVSNNGTAYSVGLIPAGFNIACTIDYTTFIVDYNEFAHAFLEKNKCSTKQVANIGNSGVLIGFTIKIKGSYCDLN